MKSLRSVVDQAFRTAIEGERQKSNVGQALACRSQKRTAGGSLPYLLCCDHGGATKSQLRCVVVRRLFVGRGNWDGGVDS